MCMCIAPGSNIIMHVFYIFCSCGVDHYMEMRYRNKIITIIVIRATNRRTRSTRSRTGRTLSSHAITCGTTKTIAYITGHTRHA